MPVGIVARTERVIDTINRHRRERTGHGFLSGLAEHDDTYVFVSVSEGSEFDRVYPIRTYRAPRAGKLNIEVLSVTGWEPLSTLD